MEIILGIILFLFLFFIMIIHYFVKGKYPEEYNELFEWGGHVDILKTLRLFYRYLKEIKQQRKNNLHK
jgi:hypothetical protein